MADDTKDGSSALDRETKRVDDMTRSKDQSHGDADTVKKEGAARVEQDDRVATVARQAKEAGAGNNEPAEDLNKDG